MDEEDLKTLIAKNPEHLERILTSFNETNTNLFNFEKFHEDGKWQQLWRALFAILDDDELQQFHGRALNCIRILTRDKDSLQRHQLDENMVCLLRRARLMPQSLLSSGNLCHLQEDSVKDGEGERADDEKKEHDDCHDDDDDDEEEESVRTIESLKCLCNMVYQSAECRRQCIRYYIVDRLIQRISTDEHQRKGRCTSYSSPSSASLSLELYDMKLLFLLSALESMVRSRLVIELNGLTYLTENLNQRLCAKAEDEEWSQPEIDISIDLLKVMYNIISHSEKSPPNEHEIQNLHLTGIMRRLLFCFGDHLTKDSMRSLISNSINLLIHMSGTCLIELLVKLDPQQKQASGKLVAFEGYNLYALNVLLEYLHLVSEGGTSSLTITDALPPILSVLVKCASSHRIMRHYIRHIILPPLRRITRPPEVGNELRNHLCRLQSNADQIVSELSSELLFICCKKNARRMVKYFGYGNMAGLFCRKGMLDCRRLDSGDLDDLSTDSEDDSDTEEYKAIEPDINPITGFYDHQQPSLSEQKEECPPRPSKSISNETRAMTEEEKEYQAMQLVQVIDKLQRDGLITPCGIGEDGKLRPVEHILELQENGGAGFLKGSSSSSMFKPTTSSSSLKDTGGDGGGGGGGRDGPQQFTK